MLQALGRRGPICLALVLGLLATPLAAGELAPDLVERLNQADPEERIPAVVLMAEFPRLESRLAEARSLSRERRRDHVVTRMKQLAGRSQQPVHALLVHGGESASKARSLWGINGIALSATPAMLEQIAGLPEVRWVLYDRDVPWQEAIDVDLEEARAEIPPFAGISEGPFAPHDGHGDGPTGGDTSGPNPNATVVGEVIAMGAKQVWDELGFTGAGVIVAVIDSGVDRTHPDLADHIWTNLDEIPNNSIDDDANGYVDDTWGWDYCGNDNNPNGGSHGTSVAGQVGGDGTNGTQTGMAPDVEFMALGINCGGVSGWWAASDYAIENGAQLITQSFSLKWPSSPDYEAFRRQTDTELAGGVFHTNSTGNTGTGSDPVPYNVATPGNVPPPWLHPDQTTVGGVSSTLGIANINWVTDNIEASSPYGPGAWEDIRANTNPGYPHDMAPEYQDYPYENGAQMGLLKPDIAAYGGSTTSTCPGTGYCGFGGTSSATPHSAGVVALMLEANPTAAPEEITQAILNTAEHRGNPGKNNRYGVGLIQAFAAVELIASPLRYHSHVIDDSATTGGNGDLALDPGETVVIPLTLRNTSAVPVDNVEAILTSTTPGVTIHNGHASFGTVPALGTKQSEANHFSLSLGSLACATSVQLQLEIRFDGDLTAAQFNARVGDEVTVVVLDEDFEGSTAGWAVGGTSAEGVWELADPIGVSDGAQPSTPEDDTTVSPGVNAWVTGNGYVNGKKDSDNNDVDGTAILTSPIFGDSPMIDLDLSYDRWIYDNQNGTGGDGLRVEVSNDGGQNWTVIEEIEDTLGGWESRSSINLAALVPPTAAMQLRFTITDGTVDSVMEGGIDELYIDGTRIDCEDFTPAAAQPPNTVGDTVRLDALPGGHVELSWDAPVVDATHDGASLYRIQRSTAPDGGFGEVGTATATEWNDVDALLSPDIYYYRVIAENAGGTEN